MLNNRQQSKFTIDDLFSPLFFFTREILTQSSWIFQFFTHQNHQIHQLFQLSTLTLPLFAFNLILTTSISPPIRTLSILTLLLSPLFTFSIPESIPFPHSFNQQKSPLNQTKHLINQIYHSFCQIATLPQ